MNKKWFAPILPYLFVWAGLFIFKSAWLTLLGFHLAILITLFFLRPQVPINTLFKKTKWKYILASIFVCVSGGLGLYFLWSLLGIAKDVHDQLALLGLNERTWASFIAYFSLVNPLMEEYFWRGVLGSDSKSLIAGDFFYAAYHVIVVWNKAHPLSMLLVLAALIFAGWFWRQIYRKDKSLLAPVFGHAAADLSILLTIYLMTK
jgi:membrane protease YdiL (CAAX protease family)